MSDENYSKASCLDKESPGSGNAQESVSGNPVLDLRGVKCPLNWAKAKVRLETLPARGVLEVVIDDPKGARDIPRAAEAEGYVVVGVSPGNSEWRIVIQT